jgi:hypothetical protein
MVKLAAGTVDAEESNFILVVVVSAPPIFVGGKPGAAAFLTFGDRPDGLGAHRQIL